MFFAAGHAAEANVRKRTDEPSIDRDDAVSPFLVARGERQPQRLPSGGFS